MTYFIFQFFSGGYMLNNCTTTLHHGIATDKMYRNKAYLMSLKTDNLLLPYRFEAGLYNLNEKKTDFHWGWDSPLSHIRGTFTGHWLSAASRLIKKTGDKELEARANYIVDELAICQKENGGQWVFPIPEKYLHWLAKGKSTWAPQYVCHKVLMGLLDMYLIAENKKALELVLNASLWFYEFIEALTDEELNNMFEYQETGGLMELWADLYAITKDEKHLKLMKRYERKSLTLPILEGVDVLTNMHANSTVPEFLGAARAYEVTGEERYRKLAEEYWNWAVDKRGTFVTGAQTSGEVWAPPYRQAARLNEQNQEHCTVYNMMRLSQYLYRWTGDKKYADYWEQNLYNGIFAAGYWEENHNLTINEDKKQKRGLITYYLPLEAVSQKMWGSETEHFWCCHCTLVQANANFHEFIYYSTDDTLYISQYLPSEVETEFNGKKIKLVQSVDYRTSSNSMVSSEKDRKFTSRPKDNLIVFNIEGNDSECKLKFRIPWWIASTPVVTINGEVVEFTTTDGYIELYKIWSNKEEVTISFPRKLQWWPLADEKETCALIDGPIAYAGICGEERTLYGDINDINSMITLHDERVQNWWRIGYKTINQPINIEFKPLYEIGYEKYTVYFPIRKNF